LTFADTAKKLRDCDSGHSRMPTDDREKFGADRTLALPTQFCR